MGVNPTLTSVSVLSAIMLCYFYLFPSFICPMTSIFSCFPQRLLLPEIPWVPFPLVFILSFTGSSVIAFSSLAYALYLL